MTALANFTLNYVCTVTSVENAIISIFTLIIFKYDKNCELSVVSIIGDI